MNSQLVFGLSTPFRRMVERLDGYAKSSFPILILGETGVGKELVAERVHRKSQRSKGPFVPVNVAALPGGLLESELFGFEKGAFSGAVQTHRGLFRQAHGGTLFLDEIGEMDLGIQAKLLRCLEGNEVRSLGSTKTERVDVRVIAATNRNLYGDSFRRDLLERLGVLKIDIPPLRDRREDIPLIAKAILSQFGWDSEGLDMEPILNYSWPGNIRQLRNVLVRASVSGGDRPTKVSLMAAIAEERESESKITDTKAFFSGSLEDIEKEAILFRLGRCHGNRKRTAEELGIAKSTLHDKLRKWNGEMSMASVLPQHNRVFES